MQQQLVRINSVARSFSNDRFTFQASVPANLWKVKKDYAKSWCQSQVWVAELHVYRYIWISVLVEKLCYTCSCLCLCFVQIQIKHLGSASAKVQMHVKAQYHTCHLSIIVVGPVFNLSLVVAPIHNSVAYFLFTTQTCASISRSNSVPNPVSLFSKHLTSSPTFNIASTVLQYPAAFIKNGSKQYLKQIWTHYGSCKVMRCQMGRGARRDRYAVSKEATARLLKSIRSRSTRARSQILQEDYAVQSQDRLVELFPQISE